MGPRCGQGPLGCTEEDVPTRPRERAGLGSWGAREEETRQGRWRHRARGRGRPRGPEHRGALALAEGASAAAPLESVPVRLPCRGSQADGQESDRCPGARPAVWGLHGGNQSRPEAHLSGWFL